jgi:membrane protein
MTLWKVFYQAVQGYIQHGDLSRGAAIAFYTVTSLAPLMLIVIALAGLVIGTDAARSGVIDEFAGLVGPQGADLIKSIVVRSSDPASGTAATVIGAIMVLVTASGIFGEMQAALNATWDVKPPDEPWMSLIRARAASLGLVAALGFVTIVSLLASAALSALGQELAMRTPAGNSSSCSSIPAFPWRCSPCSSPPSTRCCRTRRCAGATSALALRSPPRCSPAASR